MGERASAEDKLRDTPDEASRDHHGADDSGGDGQLGYRMIADDALGAVPSVGRNGGACGFRHDHHRNRTAFATVSGAIRTLLAPRSLWRCSTFGML